MKEKKVKEEVKKEEIKIARRTKAFFTGFKAFISKGNIIDLAVAVVIGGAFNAIVTSLVNDIIMPLITAAVGEASVEDLVWMIGTTPISYGKFIQAIINFLIIAFSLYLVITLVIRRKQFIAKADAVKEEPKPKEIPEDIKLLTEIRDLLAASKEEEIDKDIVEE